MAGIGKYLLETSSVDGYLTEDGAGVLILEYDDRVVRPPLAHRRWELEFNSVSVRSQSELSFNINLYPPPIPPDTRTVRAPLYHLRWELPRNDISVRSQFEVYFNINLTPPPSRPVGDQYFDTPPPIQWRQSYTQTLVLTILKGQDFFPPGERIYELTPISSYYPDSLRTWLATYNKNLVGKDRLPTGEQIYDLPPRDHERTNQLRSWTFSYNLNLIGQDRFPPGREQYTDTPPPVTWYQSWTLNLLQSTLIPAAFNPFGPFDWPLPQVAAQPQRSFEDWFNLNLIGQDFFPPGERYHDRPPGPDWRQGWLHNFNLNLIAQDAMVPGKQYYDLSPRDHQRTEQLRTWLHSFNLNLRGKDFITVGDQIYDLPPQGYPRQDQQRTWLYNYNLNLIAQDAMVVGKQYTERPPGPDWRNSWTLNLLQTTLSPVAIRPFGPFDWPNPRDYEQPNKSSQRSFNLNLIGQDLLPFRQLDWPNPQIPFYPPSNSTWLSSTLALVNRMRPFNQLDWPLPGIFQQPVRSFNHSSLQLISMVRPFNQFDWPLPGRQPEVNRSSFFTSLQLLTAPIVFPVGVQITDLPPTGYFYPASLRFASNSPQVPPPTPPTGGNFEWIIRARRRHRR